DESSLTSDQLNIKKHVNETFVNYTRPDTLPFFELSQLKKIISKFDKSKVTGFDKISYNLLKNINFVGFYEILLEFFNQLLLFKKIPKNLNTSKINPILKDNLKNSYDLNNIRPISISNCFAQILEKLILINSPDLYKV
ncbi:hypothetical protein BpHYR1_003116, partial [Brachionus plicatilis]